MVVFNKDNSGWKTGNYPLFMGQSPALHDTINVQYPEIQKLALRQVSQRWVFDEFNHDQSRLDLTTCPQSVYQVTLMNLAYQWEADSVASRAIAPLLAPFVTNSELWEALLENTNMEVTHAKTYSEIVRHCVPDPDIVFKMVMENEQTLARAETVNAVFDELEIAGAMVKLQQAGKLSFDMHPQSAYNSVFLGIVALYGLERIQFMGSFPATFAVVEQGWVQSFGTAVQKIMLDELFCHAALDREILKVEMQTEQGRRAMYMLQDRIKKLLDEIVNREFSWADYLFSEGRSIVGLNAALLKEWIMWNAKEVYELLGIKPEHPIPETNPLKWMDSWIDIDKRQNAQQEADGNNYALNTVKDDLGDAELSF